MIMPSTFVSLRGILGALLSIAVVAGNTLPTLAVVESDTKAPTISNVVVSKKTIDVIDSPQKVTVQLDISDAGSGVDTRGLNIRSEGGTGKFVVTPQNLVRTSGDDKNGRYEATVTFPSWIESGEWYFIGDIFDKAGNRYAGIQDAYSSIGASIDVVSIPDITAPTISGSVSQEILDLSDGPASFTTVATIRDTEAGFDLDNLASISLGWTVPKLASVRKNELRIEQKLTYQQITPDNDRRGNVNIEVRGVQDIVGNVTSGWGAESVGTVTLATRPFRGQRPSISMQSDGVWAEWNPPKDPLRLSSFELEVRNQNDQSTRIFTSYEPNILLSELETGKYTTRVRAINSLGKGTWSTYSEPVDFVRPKVLAPAKVSVEGTPRVGNTLTAKSGAWTPTYTELNYAWFSDSKILINERESSLALTQDHVGKRISVQVTGKLLGHSEATISSVQSDFVVPNNPLVNAPKPTFNAVKNQVVIPKSLSATYFINGQKVDVGTYIHKGRGTVTAAPSNKYYKLKGTTSWKFDNRNSVTVSKPAFDAKKNRVKIPSKTGVTYYVNGTKKKAGTHKYAGTGTVTAKASSGSYKLSGTKSWKFDNRNSVTASKPAFDAKKNRVKIPSKTGVTYYVNGTKKKAGTHKYAGTGTVTAKASSGSYKLSGTKSWKFDNRNSVTASKPAFDAKKNRVKIPSKTGVTYYVNGTKKKAGTHKYAGTGTVTAKASSGSYKLSGTKSWKFDNRNSVTASKPAFDAKKNRVKIPSKTGVTYYVNGTKKKAGTHKYTGKVTVAAKPASSGYKLKGARSWSVKL